MLDEVPAGWQRACLGDLLRLEYGRALSAMVREDGDVPVYGSNGVVGFHSTALVGRMGIVVGRKGTAGSVTVTGGPFWPIDTAYYVEARQEVDFDWLAAALRHARLSDLNESTGVPGLNRDKAYQKAIMVPPLDEQHRIAEVLKSVENVIAANDLIATQSRKTYRAALTEILGRNDHDWQTTRLGELANFINGRGFKPHEWKDAGLPIIRIQNLNGNSEFNYYDGIFNKKILVETGDLLFAWSGNRGTSFGPHIWNGPLGLLNYHTWKVVPKDKNDLDYLYFALRYLTKKVEDEAHGASALVHMQKAYIVDYEIKIPPVHERREIAQTLKELQNATISSAQALAAAQSMKEHLVRDIFSGRVRVLNTTHDTAKERVVQPAFKRAVFAAEIVHQLHADARFGSVKHEKIVHLCELHLGLQKDLGRHAYKEAAGPYDPKARRSVEGIFRQQKWFDATKADGARVVYQPLTNSGGHAAYFDRYFGERRAEIQTLIDLLRPMTTQQCEIVATLYSVWNDFLIEGKAVADSEVVQSVLNNWHPSKKQISEEQWLSALPWMRRQGLIPTGQGEKTRVPA